MERARFDVGVAVIRVEARNFVSGLKRQRWVTALVWNCRDRTLDVCDRL